MRYNEGVSFQNIYSETSRMIWNLYINCSDIFYHPCLVYYNYQFMEIARKTIMANSKFFD